MDYDYDYDSDETLCTDFLVEDDQALLVERENDLLLLPKERKEIYINNLKHEIVNLNIQIDYCINNNFYCGHLLYYLHRYKHVLHQLLN